MRLLACLLSLATWTACQHADSAERSAEITARAKPAPAVVATAPAVAQAQPPAAMPAQHGCACGGGAACACGASCGGAGDAPTWSVPANATWTALHVTGMHCGGCAKRIERALAKVDGVLGVKVDLTAARVEVAVASGVDARGLAKPTIDGLGYHVE
jgi:Cu+-exporting ATPase